MSRNRKQIDFLDKRIRKITREFLAKEEEKNEDILKLSFILENNNKILKLFWIIILLFCFSVATYQIIDRILYYLSEPVAVVTELIQNDYSMIKWPKFHVCNPLTKAIINSFPNFQESTCPSFTVILLLFKDVNVSHLWDVSNSVPDLTMDYEPKYQVHVKDAISLFGKCAAINLDAMSNKFIEKFKIKFPYFPHCHTDELRVFFHNDPLIGVERSQLLYTALEWTLEFQKITVIRTLNRRGSPCVSTKEYEDCVHRCYRSVFKKLNPRCRFPFMDVSASIPDCITTGGDGVTLGNYIAMSAVIYNDRCSCKKKCEEILYHIQLFSQPVTSNWTTISFSPNIKISIFSDIHIYTEVSFLCDLGGLLGLYFGWSLLSIVLIFTKFFYRKPKPMSITNHLRTTDVIKVKTHNLIGVIMENELRKKKNATFNIRTIQDRFMRANKGTLAYMLLLTLFFVILVANCFYNYLQMPVAVSTHIEERKFQLYPRLIVCLDSIAGLAIKQNFSETKGLSSYCDIRPIDLIGFKHNHSQLTVEEIWNKFESFNKPIASDNVNLVISSRPTYSGGCLEFYHDDRTEYSPQKMLSLVGPSIVQHPKSEECPEYKLFLASADYKEQPVEFISTEIINQFFVSIVKYEQINAKEKPCFKTMKEYEMCHQQCKSEANKAATCKLPFMIGKAKNKFCGSPLEAEAAQLQYIKKLDKCRCQVKCDIDLYDIIQDNSHMVNIPAYAIMLNIPKSVVIVIKEELSYGFIKFISDFGNLIGISLDINVLQVLSGIFFSWL